MDRAFRIGFQTIGYILCFRFRFFSPCCCSLRSHSKWLGGLYWTLGSIQPGSNWIGVVFESQQGGLEALQSRQSSVSVFLNGRIVQCASHSDPVQVAPGIWFVESHAATAEALAPGDEIAAATYHGGSMARLVLRSEPPQPQPGPHRMSANFGGQQSDPYTALGVTVEAWFVDGQGRKTPSIDQHNAIEHRADNIAAMLDSEGNWRFWPKRSLRRPCGSRSSARRRLFGACSRIFGFRRALRC